MRLVRSVAAVGILGICTFAFGEPSAVTVNLVPHGIKQPIKGSITFRAAMGSATPIVISCCYGAMTTALPPRTAWEVIPNLEGAWAARQVISVPESPFTVLLQAFPVATLIGRFEKPEGSQLPQVFTIAIYDVTALVSGNRSADEIECPIDSDGRWSCEVPSGTRDLLLHVAGFVPIQRWAVSAASRSTRDLGILQLRRGASVSGWVRLSEGKLSESVGKATVVPLAAASTGVTGSRVERPVAQAAIEKNGYFQIIGVPLGQYAIQVTYPGFAPETMLPIRVFSDRETRLRQVIVLHRPISLNIAVQPPVDSRDKPWRLVVQRSSPFSGSYDTRPVFTGASRDGAVLIRDQSPGRYMVMVSDSADNRLSTDEFEITGDTDTTHTIAIDTIRVRGKVKMGDEPLAATLWFGGRFGAQRVAMRSGEDGRFRGVLPRDGKWRITVVIDGDTSVDIRADVHSSNGEADVSLTLPSNEVTGIVVNMRGEAVGRARVILNSSDGASVTTAESASDGTFRFRAVQPGEVLLAASIETADDRSESDAVSLHVDEKGSFGPVQLLLVPAQRLTGTVRSSSGPIAGAHLTVIGVGTDQPGATTAVTDVDGHYVVRVPGKAERAMITVRAPAYALRVFDVPLPNHGAVLNVPEAGGELEIVFGQNRPEPGNQIMLAFQDDRPMPFNELFAWSSSHGMSFSPNGPFDVPDMAPAHYTICVVGPRVIRPRELTSHISGANCAEGFLAPFGKLTIDLPATP